MSIQIEVLVQSRQRLRTLSTSLPAYLVGWTPLIHLEGPPGPKLWLKLEGYKLGSSSKARPARAMIEAVIQARRLRPGQAIIVPSSGSMAIAFASLGTMQGRLVLAVVPENTAPQRLSIIQAYGAQLLLTPPMLGSDGAYREAVHLYQTDPAHYWLADQYCGPANWLAHYQTTGSEI